MASVGWLILPVVGCFGPAALETPNWNPDAAADQCMKTYDTDSDGFLTKKEYSVAPGLEYAAAYLDTDGDKKISRDEILKRIKTYQETNMNTQAHCEVYLGNRKLLDAQVEFVPEDFLSGIISTATGEAVDDSSGVIVMTSQGQPFDAVEVGMYRVKVTSPSVEIRPEYNEQTTLGVELSGVTTPGQEGVFRFVVKGK